MFEMFPQFPCCTLRVNGLCSEAVGECEHNFHIIRIYLWYGGGWVVGVPGALMANLSKPRKYIYASYACGHKIFYKRMCEFRFPIEETPNSTRRRQNCCLLCARALAIADRTHYNVSIFWPLCVSVSQQRLAHVKLKWNRVRC